MTHQTKRLGVIQLTNKPTFNVLYEPQPTNVPLPSNQLVLTSREQVSPNVLQIFIQLVERKTDKRIHGRKLQFYSRCLLCRGIKYSYEPAHKKRVIIIHDAQRSTRVLTILKVHNITTIQDTGIHYIRF